MNMKPVEQLMTTLRHKGIEDERVLQAIQQVPREQFVAQGYEDQAYDDNALPFAHGQTISQPYVVARMSELLCEGRNHHKVLEIGTGTGYQAAVLSHLVGEVFSIERIEALYYIAKKRLMAYPNVKVKYGDGYLGWGTHAPFDGIIATAAAAHLPESLVEQLSIGGRMVIPLGDAYGQVLTVVDKHTDGVITTEYDPVRFVPMLTGKEEE